MLPRSTGSPGNPNGQQGVCLLLHLGTPLPTCLLTLVLPPWVRKLKIQWWDSLGKIKGTSRWPKPVFLIQSTAGHCLSEATPPQFCPFLRSAKTQSSAASFVLAPCLYITPVQGKVKNISQPWTFLLLGRLGFLKLTVSLRGKIVNLSKNTRPPDLEEDLLCSLASCFRVRLPIKPLLMRNITLING